MSEISKCEECHGILVDNLTSADHVKNCKLNDDKEKNDSWLLDYLKKELEDSRPSV